MICLLALIVFGILGIFSVSYRKLFYEACDCVFRRFTFRKCRTSLDKRIKSQLTGSLLKYSPRSAQFLFRYFEVFSWIFLILLVVSTFYTARSIYNYVEYGNCNGPASNEFCIFDPLATQQVSVCHDAPGSTNKEPTPPTDISQMKSFGDTNAKIQFIEFGCYTCQYTKKAQPVVKQVLQNYGEDIHFVFIDFPLPSHNDSFEIAMAANCVYNQSKDAYTKFANQLFTLDNDPSAEEVSSLAKDTVPDYQQYIECIQTKAMESFVKENEALAHQSNIYGTPTFFINGKPVVGPQPYKTFKKLINDELKK